MKEVNLTKVILGIIMLLVSLLIAFGSTYAYDYFEGHAGREIIIVMFGLMMTFGTFAGALMLIIKGVDKYM